MRDFAAEVLAPLGISLLIVLFFGSLPVYVLERLGHSRPTRLGIGLLILSLGCVLVAYGVERCSARSSRS